MEIIFLPQADADLEYWKSMGNERILKRIRALLEDIQLHPFSGIGKPEALKGTNGVAALQTNTGWFTLSAMVASIH